jgi:hypothetical protein
VNGWFRRNSCVLAYISALPDKSNRPAFVAGYAHCRLLLHSASPQPFIARQAGPKMLSAPAPESTWYRVGVRGMPQEEAELNMRLFAERVMPVLQRDPAFAQPAGGRSPSGRATVPGSPPSFAASRPIVRCASHAPPVTDYFQPVAASRSAAIPPAAISACAAAPSEAAVVSARTSPTDRPSARRAGAGDSRPCSASTRRPAGARPT